MLARLVQLVVFAPGGTLLGAAYTQRIASSQAPLDVAAETELEPQTPSGPVLQLLGIVQRPGARVGALLRTSALLMASLDGTVELACAVARCASLKLHIHATTWGITMLNKHHRNTHLPLNS